LNINKTKIVIGGGIKRKQKLIKPINNKPKLLFIKIEQKGGRLIAKAVAEILNNIVSIINFRKS
tara:strand:+ start:308 stop:499 length:192 start_codon:yes stop_codon:yes gene_type:complete